MHADANNSEGTSLEAVLGQELQHPHIVSTLTYTIKTIDAAAVPVFPPVSNHRNKNKDKDKPSDAKASETKVDPKAEYKTAEAKPSEVIKPPGPPLATAMKSSNRLGVRQIAFAVTPQPLSVRGTAASCAFGAGGAAGASCQPVVDSFQCIDSFGASGNYFMINSDSEKPPVEEIEDVEALGLKQYQSWIVMVGWFRISGLGLGFRVWSCLAEAGVFQLRRFPHIQIFSGYAVSPGMGTGSHGSN